MCGIFSIINYISNTNIDKKIIDESFIKGMGRGPEFSSIDFFKNYNSLIGFHRLAINGLNSESNQPIIIDDITLICNGEIYNYLQLYDMIPHVEKKTDSDCEIIIHLFKNFGIEHTLRLLDGVFAFILYTPDNIYIARDPYGVRPLYCYINNEHNYPSFFASELKCLSDIPQTLIVSHFKPSHYFIFKRFENYYKPYSYNKYHTPSFPTYYSPNIFNEDYYLNTIYNYLKTSVHKRCSTTSRPIACLLSGGLDSSLIAALVSNYVKENGMQPIETYSIGLPDSEDVKFATIVAEFIGSKHTSIIVSEMDMINAIPDVIKDIESYDTTTVRASIGNWLIGKYISKNSEAKVIFNGDGSDELCGGYLYMKMCPNDIEFDKETIRLLNDIYLFDVLRSDKSISSHGLEPRTPFLDKNFVNAYLSIPLKLRRQPSQIEKYLLRKAFDNKNLLPDNVLWRKKEAFSDGVSNKGRSLFQIIQEYINKNFNNNNLSLIDAEKEYYKNIFLKLYPKSSNIIPYYWMPKYIEAKDPSARTLNVYSL